MRKILIEAIPDYIQGHLHGGHYEGTVELTDEEEDLDLDLLIDDYVIDDVGSVSTVDWREC